MKRKSRSSTEEAEIDMTPMLDVTFIMLIFFIVTTSFAKEFGIDVNRPTASNQQTVKSSQVIGIELSENGEITMDNRIVDVAAVRVIDQARQAGASNISVAATSQ